MLTCWVARDRVDAAVPERLRRVDLARGLPAAGFEDVRVREPADWRAAELAMWREAAALDPGDDPALRSFHDEAVRSLPTFDLVRRVLAVARRPLG